MVMNNFQNVYNTHEYRVAKGLLQYYFVSKGDKDIVKVVQYQYVKDFDGRPLFNLGFGDYNMDTGVVSDEYIFKGGEGIENQNLIESYQKGKKYNAVLVMRKNS